MKMGIGWIVLSVALLSGCYQTREPATVLSGLPQADSPYHGSIVYPKWVCRDIDDSFVYLLYRVGSGSGIKSAKYRIPRNQVVFVGVVHQWVDQPVDIRIEGDKVMISLEQEKPLRLTPSAFSGLQLE